MMRIKCYHSIWRMENIQYMLAATVTEFDTIIWNTQTLLLELDHKLPGQRSLLVSSLTLLLALSLTPDRHMVASVWEQDSDFTQGIPFSANHRLTG